MGFNGSWFCICVVSILRNVSKSALIAGRGAAVALGARVAVSEVVSKAQSFLKAQVQTLRWGKVARDHRGTGGVRAVAHRQIWVCFIERCRRFALMAPDGDKVELVILRLDDGQRFVLPLSPIGAQVDYT